MKIALVTVVCLAIGALVSAQDESTVDESSVMGQLQDVAKDAATLLKEAVAKEVDKKIKEQRLKRLKKIRGRAKGLFGVIQAFFGDRQPTPIQRVTEMVSALLDRVEKRLKS
uniref:Uncharacterized protein n=1 Tax=Lygus hesperus TaxID=30085 RepID=A0A0K8T189_LYGHE